MSPKSRRKRGRPAKKEGLLAPPTLRARVDALEAYLRPLSAHRLVDPSAGVEALAKPTIMGLNALQRSTTRESLDSAIASLSRLNGHLDSLCNYLSGSGGPTAAGPTGEAPTPFSVEDKLALVDSRLSYALSRTEELLNRF